MKLHFSINKKNSLSNRFYCKIFRVDEESRKKDELIHEIKRLQKTLISYQYDQNHLLDTLKQLRRYQQFLFKFAPSVSCFIILFEKSIDLFYRNGVITFLNN